MVSFQCESCGDVLTKKKLDPHRGRCRGASFSCIDCMTHFYGTDYRAHTSCMTEDQKYQGALYKNKNKKARFNPPSNDDEPSHFATPVTPAPVSAATSANMAAAVRQYYQPPAHAAFVEDVPEELESYLVADNDENAGPSDDDAPPHAPTPPPADDADDGGVNVFDFLVDATPNGSSLELVQAHAAAAAAANPSGLGFDYDVNAFLDSPSGYAAAAAPKRQLIDYGSAPPPGALPANAYQTPGPVVRTDRKKKDKDSSSAADKDGSSKKDKKRKRLHLDIHDQVMADAPPVLHSGLTGGLNRMSTKSPAVYPPSPASAAETPASPLKKTKHAKNRSPRHDATAGNSLFSMLASAAAAGSKTKTKKRKHHASSPTSNKKHSKTHRHHHHHHRHHRHHHDGDKDGAAAGADGKKAPKLLEYKKDGGDDSGANANNQMVVLRPRADLFMSFVDKGADSERGCSLNKALKYFHRERSESADALIKSAEEKELFRALRLRRNDRGEVVLFSKENR